MSGLEALAGACAIFQTASFAKEIFTLCYSFYNDKPVAFDRLEDYAAGMEREMFSIRRYAETMQQQLSPAGSADDQEFIKVLKKAEETAAQLRDEVAYVLERRQSGSVLKALRTSFRYHKRKNAVDGLKSDMEDCDRRIKFMLSNRDARSLDALTFQTSTGFATLSDEVKGFIEKLADRQREDQKILESKFVDLDAHVTQGHLETRNFVDDRISQRTAREETSRAHQQLIDSLYFPEMSARENRIDLDEASFEEAFHLEEVNGSDTDQAQVGLERSRTNAVQATVEDFSEKTFHDRDTELQQSESSSDSFSLSSDTSSRTNSSHSNVGPWTERVKAEVCRLRTWMDTGNTPFWISGYAGSGKSTLVKFLARQESQHSKANPELKREVSAHYFWKADSLEMQKSKRGCFCSLLYQMLQHDRKRCQSLLDQCPGLAQKKNPGDWSNSELLNAFRYLIKGSSNTFVFFLDGLDEAGDDEELFPILEMIELQSQLPNTRFCVSSRPETILKQRLEHNPTIVVQDLNYNNMMVSTRRKLGPIIARNKNKWTTSRGESLFSDIVKRANGIFLWLELVTNIIRRDISQGEEPESVDQRLDGLPSKLIPLFNDMWKRIGPDFAWNQKLAASFISFVILHKHIRQVGEDEGVYHRGQESPLLTVILFAVYSEETNELFGTKDHAGLLDHVAWLEARQHHITTYCMGLLVCTPRLHRRRPLKQDQRRPLELATRLEDAGLLQNVAFVHRSAYDYFTATEEGRRICSQGTLPYEAACMSLARGYAFQLHLLAEIEGSSPGSTFFNRAWGLQSVTVNGINALVQAAGSDKQSLIHAKDTVMLLAKSHDALGMGHYFYSLACRHKDMLQILIGQCLVSPEIATGVLRFYWLFNGFSFVHPTSRLTPPLLLTQTMMKLGANPHKVETDEHKSAFGEYLHHALSFSNRPLRIRTPLEAWVFPGGLLAALDVFLKINPKLDETILHTLYTSQQVSLYTHRDFPIAYFKPLAPEYRRWHRDNGLTCVLVAFDYLYLCEEILVQLSGSDISDLDPSPGFFALLSDVRQHLTYLQELQGLRKNQQRALLGLSIAKDGQAFSWRTKFDAVSIGTTVAEFVGEHCDMWDSRTNDHDQDHDLDRLVNALMWTDDIFSGPLDSDAKRKLAELSESVELHEWSQKSADVHTMTWDEAYKCAKGEEFPDIPFDIRLEDDGSLKLSSKEYS